MNFQNWKTRKSRLFIASLLILSAELPVLASEQDTGNKIWYARGDLNPQASEPAADRKSAAFTNFAMSVPRALVETSVGFEPTLSPCRELALTRLGDGAPLVFKAWMEVGTGFEPATVLCKRRDLPGLTTRPHLRTKISCISAMCKKD